MNTTAADPTPRADDLTARLELARQRVGRAVLDGGWWPRSQDPAAEIPPLVAALTLRYGPIRDLMLSSAAWADRPRRLTAGTRVIRVGWFASQDPALAIAITAGGDQLDLLVVPPETPAAAAARAMAAAADPEVFTSAGGILTALSAAEPAGAGDSAGVWENEGGRALGGPPVPAQAGAPRAAGAILP